MIELNGADIVVRCLAEEGVEHVFGYPGGAVLYIYDAIFKQDKFQHILVRHEQAAIHAADAYSRSSLKTGVAIVTSGPGVTNAITGIATAYMDSIPMVIISGQVPTAAIGEDAFQECDTVGITRPCVKHNFLVRDIKDLADTMRRAFYIARTGRPGPVLVDIPKDITLTPGKYTPPKGEISMRSYAPVVKGHQGQIKKAIQMLLTAERPMIYSGGGVILSDASQELRDFVQLVGAPCTNTLMGLGAYPASNRQFVGMPGMHGTYEANMAMQHCDVLVDMITQYKQLAGPNHAASFGKWWEQIDAWRARDCLKYTSSDEVIKPQYVVEKLWEVTGGDAFVTSDVGQHQMWAAQYYRFDAPRRWINSGGLGTMGVGLPYAMGVQMANPGRDVAVITGEASIQMNIQELSTCHQYHLSPKIICLNNRFLGMVRQWQQIDYGSRYSESYMDSLPDFVKVAEAYGHMGLRIEKPADVEPALREAFKHKDRLVFMDFITDRTENVFPMVKAGRGLTEMLLGSEDL